MSKYKKLNFSHLKVVIFLIFCVPAICLSQDIHFSQFEKASLFTNSAQTGIFDGSMRISGSYRNQWRQIDQPFNSLQLSADTRTRFYGRTIGLGALFLHDQSSNSYLTTDKFFFSVSHSWFIRNHQLVIGLQPGYTLKSYDKSKITFGSQFDPTSQTYDPGLPSSEDQLSDKLQYFDLNAGFFWRSKYNNLSPFAGASFQHINMPIESFSLNSDSTRLGIKYSLNAGIKIPLTERSSLEPVTFYNTTTATHEFLAGSYVHYRPPFWQPTVTRLSGYSVVRINPFTNIDAWVIGGNVQILNLEIGLSYDINISKLRQASNYKGAFEVSLVYITNKRSKSSIPEPCYIM